jgi:hypothetical protein
VERRRSHAHPPAIHPSFHDVVGHGEFSISNYRYTPHPFVAALARFVAAVDRAPPPRDEATEHISRSRIQLCESTATFFPRPVSELRGLNQQD